MANTLLDLPPELLVRVASYLTTPELGPLRRSCKQVERYLFDAFALEFFTKRQFMIEHESLEALVGIANHPGLAAKLKTVIISVQKFSLTSPSDDEMAKRRFATGHVSQHMLLRSGLARDMLADAFSKLPNLHTVGLRDYDGAGRIRDGPSARWRSWGWCLSPVTRLELDSPGDIFPVIMSALAAGKAKPANIEVILRHTNGLFSDSFDLPDGSILPILKTIKTLMFRISTASSYHREKFGTPWNPYDDKNIVEAPLRQFLHFAPSLMGLRLNFEPREFFAPRFLEWLGKTPSTSPSHSELRILPHSPPHLSALTSLELGMANATGPVLLRVLSKFDLTSFSLWKMVLQHPGPDVLSADCWAELLEQLSTALRPQSRIRTILIGHASQCYFKNNHPFLDGPDVRFVEEGTDPNDRAKAKMSASVTFQAGHTAKTVHQWLRELSQRTFVPGIHTPRPRLSDSEDDSAASDDEDDENEDFDQDDQGEDDE